jgi:hypothetical protein
MTPPATSVTIVDCPLCGQQFRRVRRNGSVSYFDADTRSDPGTRCPFGDQRRIASRNAGTVSASRPQSSPDGCFKDLVVKMHELHQLERRSYDGAMLVECECTPPTCASLCTAATPAAITNACQAFVTIWADLATFMQCRDIQEHKCPACGRVCRNPTRSGCGLCADCVASGLPG